MSASGDQARVETKIAERSIRRFVRTVPVSESLPGMGSTSNRVTFPVPLYRAKYNDLLYIRKHSCWGIVVFLTQMGP